MSGDNVILIGDHSNSAFEEKSTQPSVNEVRMERIDIPLDKQIPNVVMEKLLPAVGREIVVNNTVIMKVGYVNLGKRRAVFEVVGLLRPVKDV